jgi:hypothetical protein
MYTTWPRAPYFNGARSVGCLSGEPYTRSEADIAAQRQSAGRIEPRCARPIECDLMSLLKYKIQLNQLSQPRTLYVGRATRFFFLLRSCRTLSRGCHTNPHAAHHTTQCSTARHSPTLSAVY